LLDAPSSVVAHNGNLLPAQPGSPLIGMCGWMGRGHGFKLLRCNDDFRACSPRRARVA
jgi:hypothetical protein